jgi:hypothetical protein
MSSFVIYLAGGALATSFMDNSKLLRGLSWLLTSALIATLAIINFIS